MGAIMGNNNHNNQQSTTEKADSKQLIPESDKNRLKQELEEITLEQKEIDAIKDKAKEKANVTNPFIICISTKTNNANVFPEQKSNSDITLIEGKTHKDIKQELTNKINRFDTSKYDAIIVVPIGICFVGDNNSVKFFYDKQEEPRHLEKIKKDIVYRLDEPAVLIDCRKAVTFPIIDKNNDDDHAETMNLRPGDQMEQSVPNDMIVWKKKELFDGMTGTNVSLEVVTKSQQTKPSTNNEIKEEEEYDGEEQKGD